MEYWIDGMNTPEIMPLFGSRDPLIQKSIAPDAVHQSVLLSFCTKMQDRADNTINISHGDTELTENQPLRIFSFQSFF